MSVTREGLTENEALRKIETWCAQPGESVRSCTIEHVRGSWLVMLCCGSDQVILDSTNLTWVLYDVFIEAEKRGWA